MIVIPMAGLSKRFSEAGYGKPKYMLPLAGRTVFDHAVSSFRSYFDSEAFLFIALDVRDVRIFVERACQALGISMFTIVVLDAPTTGQAETVELGLRKAAVNGDEAITIFNVDTFRHGFMYPRKSWWQHSDGYLEVFEGSGANWSYARPSDVEPGRVVETAEKNQISNLCCTGLYRFTRALDFLQALEVERCAPTSKELYVAPLYNHLIAAGQRIHFDEIDRSQVVFCGVPSEYESLCGAGSS
jgi:hypothetical protein